MINEKINLNKLYPSLPYTGTPAILETFCRSASPEYGENRAYPGMVICPGGAYAFTSAREAEPIALVLLSKGIQSFVLWYTTKDTHYPVHLLETAAAFDYLRKNAAKYQLKPDALGIMGFSAGGHLAGSYGTLWGDGILSKTLGTARENLRPNAMALCYGVLTTGIHTHGGSISNLLGDNNTEELREKLSVEKNVSYDTPAAFIWHTFEDSAVPVENSLLTAEALAKAKIPFELHVYPDGCHGLALANWLTTAEPEKGVPPKYIARWIDDCAAWLLRVSGFEYK